MSDNAFTSLTGTEIRTQTSQKLTRATEALNALDAKHRQFEARLIELVSRTAWVRTSQPKPIEAPSQAEPPPPSGLLSRINVLESQVESWTDIVNMLLEELDI